MRAFLHILTLLLSCNAFANEKKQFFSCDFKNDTAQRIGKVLVGPMNLNGDCEEESVIVEKFYCAQNNCSWETHRSSKSCYRTPDGKTIRIMGTSNHNVPATTMWEATKYDAQTYKGKHLVNESEPVEMTCKVYFDTLN